MHATSSGKLWSGHLLVVVAKYFTVPDPKVIVNATMP